MFKFVKDTLQSVPLTVLPPCFELLSPSFLPLLEAVLLKNTVKAERHPAGRQLVKPFTVSSFSFTGPDSSLKPK